MQSENQNRSRFRIAGGFFLATILGAAIVIGLSEGTRRLLPQLSASDTLAAASPVVAQSKEVRPLVDNSGVLDAKIDHNVTAGDTQILKNSGRAKIIMEYNTFNNVPLAVEILPPKPSK